MDTLAYVLVALSTLGAIGIFIQTPAVLLMFFGFFFIFYLIGRFSKDDTKK